MLPLRVNFFHILVMLGKIPFMHISIVFLFFFFFESSPKDVFIDFSERRRGRRRERRRERERERRERNIYVRQLNHLAKTIVLFFIKNTITLKELLLFSKKNLQQYINNMFIYQETCIHLKHILNGN